jgi:hypothetical protein
MSHLEGDQVEESFLEIGKTFHGEIMPDTNEDKAYQVAVEWTEDRTRPEQMDLVRKTAESGVQ